VLVKNFSAFRKRGARWSMAALAACNFFSRSELGDDEVPKRSRMMLC
jgi:hypothetical protein